MGVRIYCGTAVREQFRAGPTPSRSSVAWTPGPRRARDRHSGSRPGTYAPPLLPQDVRDLVPEAPRLRVRLLAGDRGEPLEQLALLLREVRRRLDRDAHVLVAAAAAAERGDALPLQPEHLPALRAGRDLELRRAVERRHVDRRAERRLRERDRHLAEDLGVLAREDRVLAHLQHDVEVAGRAARDRRGLALAGELEARAGVDARRDLHLDGGLLARARPGRRRSRTCRR